MGERDKELKRKAWLERFDSAIELPMAALGLVWLGLIIAELVWGASGWLEWLSYGIWTLFIVEFVVRVAYAPRKGEYLRDHWITLVSLVLPFLRVFSAPRRALHALSALRGLQLARVVAALGKTKSGLGDIVRQNGLRYVLALTVLVNFGGAAGMYAFERGAADGGLPTYADALWWTAMLLTTIGSQYWPHTAEGRVLALLLSAYALGVLGYITAALASFLIGGDASDKQHRVAGARTVDALRADVERLTAQVERLANRFETQPESPARGPRED